MTEPLVATVDKTPRRSDSLAEDDDDWTEVEAWEKCQALLRFRDDDPELNALENSGYWARKPVRGQVIARLRRFYVFQY